MFKFGVDSFIWTEVFSAEDLWIIPKAKELTFDEIERIADEAIAMDCMYALLTGGEPLLRPDFEDIYVMLKKKGFMISLFTNATLITEKTVELFKKYPPDVVEVSIYGVSEEVYEKVTRKKGTYKAMVRGLDLLLAAGIKTRLKAMVLKSNICEIDEIAAFCRKHTVDYYRYDPLLSLRNDLDEKRNETIKKERLSPEEIIWVENKDKKRMDSLVSFCEKGFGKATVYQKGVDIPVLACGAGKESVVISADGMLRACSALVKEELCYDIRKGSLDDAFYLFLPEMRQKTVVQNQIFFEKCGSCEYINLCHWCPAHAYVETGALDKPIDFFCEVAHKRYENIKELQN